jgi:hypothetical protein
MVGFTLLEKPRAENISVRFIWEDKYLKALIAGLQDFCMAPTSKD